MNSYFLFCSCLFFDQSLIAIVSPGISMDLFAHLPCPALILARDFTIDRANSAACSLFGIAEYPDPSLHFSLLCRHDLCMELQEAVFSLESPQEKIKRTMEMQKFDEGLITVGVCLNRIDPDQALMVLTEHDEDSACVPGCRKLRLLEAQYQNNPAGILLVDADMHMLSFNRRFVEMWNIPEDIQQKRDDKESLQRVLAQVKDPDSFLDRVYALYKNPHASSTDEIRLKDGRVFYRHSIPVYQHGEYFGRVWYFLDITSLKAAQRKIVRQQKFQKAILEHIHDGIVACNARGQLTTFNRASREIHGCDLTQIPQQEWGRYYQLYRRDGTTPLNMEEIPLIRAFRGEEVSNAEIVVYARNGSRRDLRVNGQAMYDNEGNKLGAVVSLHDITDLNQANRRLRHLAYHDALTGLANRRLFHDLLSQELKRAERKSQFTAVLFLDLDNFKKVNDQYGHKEGDRLLIQLASVLRLRLRDSDILCRWGGDEFIIALPEVAGDKTAVKVADKICKVVNADIASRYPDCDLGASIGIALFPNHGHGPDSLIRQADMAMYLAKQQGKNRACLVPSESAATLEVEQCTTLYLTTKTDPF